MNYREDISLILEAVTAAIPRDMTIVDVQVNTDSTISIEVCDMRYAEPERVVTIDGNNYTILEINDQARTIKLSAGPAITVTTFDLYPVFFFDGTPLQVEKDVRDIPLATNKTPMVFMLIPYRQHIYHDAEDIRERDFIGTLFFLTQAKFDSWSQDVFMANAVRPMDRLQQMFLEQINTDTARFQRFNKESDVTPRIKFGVYVSNKGVQKAFQAMDLSGVQWDASLTLLKGPCLPDECP